MNIKDKIKESIISNIVEKIFALGAILVGIAWLVLKPAIIQHILPALSKELLAGLLAVALIVLLTLGAYIFYLRRKFYPHLIYRFGVRWDEAQNPYCPKDPAPLQIKKSTLGMGLERFPDELTCATCARTFTLTDENGFAIFEVKDAKKRLISR